MDKEYRLSEGVATYFNNQLSGLWQCTKLPGDLYGLAVLRSTMDGTPFMIARARLKEDKNGLPAFAEWFRKILPKAIVSKCFQEGREIECAFYVPKHYLTEVEDLSFPKFPQDRVDGMQVVSFALPTPIDKGQFAVFQNAITECGAASKCYMPDGKELVIEVPCSYQNSGVYGRAFESRLAYITKQLEKIYTEPLSRTLAERKPISSYETPKPAANIQVLSYIPEQLAFVKKIASVPKSEIPFLFELVQKKSPESGKSAVESVSPLTLSTTILEESPNLNSEYATLRNAIRHYYKKFPREQVDKAYLDAQFKVQRQGKNSGHPDYFDLVRKEVRRILGLGVDESVSPLTLATTRLEESSRLEELMYPKKSGFWNKFSSLFTGDSLESNHVKKVKQEQSRLRDWLRSHLDDNEYQAMENRISQEMEKYEQRSNELEQRVKREKNLWTGEELSKNADYKLKEIGLDWLEREYDMLKDEYEKAKPRVEAEAKAKAEEEKRQQEKAEAEAAAKRAAAAQKRREQRAAKKAREQAQGQPPVVKTESVEFLDEALKSRNIAVFATTPEDKQFVTEFNSVRTKVNALSDRLVRLYNKSSGEERRAADSFDDKVSAVLDKFTSFVADAREELDKAQTEEEKNKIKSWAMDGIRRFKPKFEEMLSEKLPESMTLPSTIISESSEAIQAVMMFIMQLIAKLTGKLTGDELAAAQSDLLDLRVEYEGILREVDQEFSAKRKRLRGDTEAIDNLEFEKQDRIEAITDDFMADMEELYRKYGIEMGESEIAEVENMLCESLCEAAAKETHPWLALQRSVMRSAGGSAESAVKELSQISRKVARFYRSVDEYRTELFGVFSGWEDEIGPDIKALAKIKDKAAKKQKALALVNEIIAAYKRVPIEESILLDLPPLTETTGLVKSLAQKSGKSVDEVQIQREREKRKSVSAPVTFYEISMPWVKQSMSLLKPPI